MEDQATHPEGVAVDGRDGVQAPRGGRQIHDCGKTTTLRMINRMVEPASGTIKVGGCGPDWPYSDRS